MRARFFMLTLLILGATSLGASELWIHVRVTETGFRPTSVEVNLPLRLAERLAPILDDAYRHDHDGDVELILGHDEMDVRELREKWTRLKEGEVLVEDDTTLRLVDGPEGEELLISERDRRGRARVTLPADVIEALLSGSRDRLDMTAAVAALARHGEGELVSAREDGAIVRIWLDRDAEPRD